MELEGLGLDARYQMIDGIPVFGDVQINAVQQMKRAMQHERVVGGALTGDHHFGFGVPVGGVIAYEEGISPTGVGVDIGCFVAGTPVAVGDGCVLPIEQVRADDGSECWDGSAVRPISPHFGCVERGRRAIVELKLSNGRVLRCTPDHLLLTGFGWMRADEAKTVAVRVFRGYEREAFVMPEWAHGLTVRQFAALVRLLGAINGDGHLPKGSYRVSFYNTEYAMCESVRRDLELLGAHPTIAVRDRRPEWSPEVHVYADNKELRQLFEVAGAAVGKKVWDFGRLAWLLDMPAWIRAQFLSGFASAEMMTPRYSKDSVPSLTIKQVSALGAPSPLLFIGRLLGSLGFACSGVVPSGPPRGQRITHLIQILGGADAAVAYLERVGFCYSPEKREAGTQVASWWWNHEAAVANRRAAHAAAGRLREEGVYWRDAIADVQEMFDVPRSLAFHAFYGRGKPRLMERVEPTCEGEIAWISVIDCSYSGEAEVYDIATGDPAESFFADGAVVHNCGNKAVLTDMPGSEARSAIAPIMDAVAREVSFGMGRSNPKPIDHELFDDVRWREKWVKDLKQRAQTQLGTCGSGNHYVDIFVDELDRTWIGVHFGSRGLGHNIAKRFHEAAGWPTQGDVEPLVLPTDEQLGQEYIEMMDLGLRYAFAGRDYVCKQVAQILGAKIVDEVHNNHNAAWLEEHGGRKVWVVRKGATPAFPGQYGFIGGSMGDNAVIVQGTDSEISTLTFASTVHGAGRVMSRTEAKGKYDRKTGELKKKGRISREEMMTWVRSKGVELRGGDLDEAPQAYRRLDSVLKAHGDSIKIMHTLTPIGVAMAGADVFDPYKD